MKKPLTDNGLLALLMNRQDRMFPKHFLSVAYPGDLLKVNPRLFMEVAPGPNTSNEWRDYYRQNPKETMRVLQSLQAPLADEIFKQLSQESAKEGRPL